MAAGSKALGVGGAGPSRLLQAWSPRPQPHLLLPPTSAPSPLGQRPPHSHPRGVHLPDCRSLSHCWLLSILCPHDVALPPDLPRLSHLTHTFEPLLGESPQLSLDVEDDPCSGPQHHRGGGGEGGGLRRHPDRKWQTALGPGLSGKCLRDPP